MAIDIADPELNERVRLMCEALEPIGFDEQQLDDWFNAEHELLDDRTPLEAVLAGDFDQVDALIEMVVSGAYA